MKFYILLSFEIIWPMSSKNLGTWVVIYLSIYLKVYLFIYLKIAFFK